MLSFASCEIVQSSYSVEYMWRVFSRKSLLDLLYKIGVLKNFSNSQENTCVLLWYRCCPVNSEKLIRQEAPILQNTFGRLLLDFWTFWTFCKIRSNVTQGFLNPYFVVFCIGNITSNCPYISLVIQIIGTWGSKWNLPLSLFYALHVRLLFFSVSLLQLQSLCCFLTLRKIT